MISFVITIADLFTMDSGFGQEINFKQNKHRLVIPVYQREYKWEMKGLPPCCQIFLRTASLLAIPFWTSRMKDMKSLMGNSVLQLVFNSCCTL